MSRGLSANIPNTLRNCDVSFPKYRTQALQRIDGLRKRFSCDKELSDDYTKFAKDKDDMLEFRISLKDEHMIRRVVLSTIGSIYIALSFWGLMKHYCSVCMAPGWTGLTTSIETIELFVSSGDIICRCLRMLRFLCVSSYPTSRVCIISWMPARLDMSTPAVYVWFVVDGRMHGSLGDSRVSSLKLVTMPRREDVADTCSHT